jgi:hypothetical protein
MNGLTLILGVVAVLLSVNPGTFGKTAKELEKEQAFKASFMQKALLDARHNLREKHLEEKERKDS